MKYRSQFWKPLAGIAAAVLLPAVAAPSQLFRMSESQYVNSTEKGLELTRSRIPRQPRNRLEFSANLFFAHEALIEHVPLDVLTREIDAFRDMGLNRVDINMGLFPWADNRRDIMDKYDALIRHIRQAGLKLVINPQYSVTYHKMHSLDEWRKAALPVYAEIARRYHPDIMVVAHEPSTMAKRMGARIGASEWADFAREAARTVKKESPNTRCGAGGLYSEKDYFEEFLALPEIDVMTIDVYNLAGLREYNKLIEAAKSRGKPVYIEETWRPPYVGRGGGLASLETISAKGIGNSSFEDLDAQWLETMAEYASAWGLEAITPFWTQTFFLYVSDDGDALTPEYNNRVMDAVQKGSRTRTYDAYRNLIRQLGISGSSRGDRR